jgi:hypothetical protein
MGKRSTDPGSVTTVRPNIARRVFRALRLERMVDHAIREVER